MATDEFVFRMECGGHAAAVRAPLVIDASGKSAECAGYDDKEKDSVDTNHLEHLFLVGEFAKRERLLSGLTLEQVTLRPEGASHSIYDELWHLVGYQQSIVAPGPPVSGDLYPTSAPEDERQWHDLVQLFLTGARTAADLGQEPARLAAELQPGETLGDELMSVAVHNAYHFGKIVALRQRIGAWPPASDAS